MWSFVWVAVASASILEYNDIVQPSTLTTLAREGIYPDTSGTPSLVEISRNLQTVNIQNPEDKNATLAVLIGSKEDLTPIITFRRVNKPNQLKITCENNKLIIPASLINSGAVSLYPISSSSVIKTV